MPFFFLKKNPLGSKMKKGIRTFCSTEGSTSTLNQHMNNDENPRQSSPTLEDLILQLELEEEIARNSKLNINNGKIMRGRMSCVNNSDILRSARNALNQYPRFSLDGRDALYRSSFGIPEEGRKSVCCDRSLGRRLHLEEDEDDDDDDNDYGVEAKFKKTLSLPSTVAGESVVWCEPGVVAKLMGLEAMPVPVRSRKEKVMMSGIMKRQNYLRRRFERHLHHQELERRLAMDMKMMQGRYYGGGSGIRSSNKTTNGCCSRNDYCIMKPLFH